MQLLNIKKKGRSLAYLFLLVLMPAMAGCGLFAGLGEDTPFAFPDIVEDVGGSDGSDDPVDLCEGVQCNVDEECNASDGSCQSVSQTPDCSQDSDCDPIGEDTQICTDGSCVSGCRDDVDCAEDETCDTLSDTCNIEVCPDAPVCTQDQFLNTQTCLCEDIPVNDVCELQWRVGTQAQQNTGLKLYIDTEVSSTDLPNPCDQQEETDEFGCTMNQNAETDEALIMECNKLGGQSKTNCLARTNVALIPFATRNEQNVRLYLKPDDPQDPNAGGTTFLRASEFPQFLIYNNSPDLAAILLIGGGRGELMAPGITMPEVVGEGTYSVDGEGRISIDSMPFHFRAVNIVKAPPPGFESFEHTVPPPLAITQLITDFDDQLFQSDPTSILLATNLAASGLECPTSGVHGVSILPSLANPPLVFTTGVNTDATPSQAFQQQNVASTITLTGCPIGPASECDCTLGPDGELPPQAACGTDPGSDPDEPWMRLATGLTIPDGTCLLGIGGAALGAEIEGPIRNADGTPFTDLASACDIQGGGTDGGGSGGGDFDLIVKQDDVEVDLEEPDPGFLEAEVEFEDSPFYKEEEDLNINDSQLLARFEAMTAITVINQGAGDTPDFSLSSNSTAFEIASADLINGTVLNPNEQRTFQVIFKPEEPMPAGCQVDGNDPDLWNCTADINVFEGGGLTLVVTAQARRPAADVQIYEVGAVEGENYNVLLQPQLIPGDGEVDYGVTSVGTYVIKAYEITNSGVRDLTVDAIQSQDPTFNFLGGVIRQGPSLADSEFGQGILPAMVSTDGSDNLYFYEVYWPSGLVGNNPADCDGKPCRVDGASVLVQTSEGPRALLLSGKMTEDLVARLHVYIEDPVLLDDQIENNPHLIDCNNPPEDVICNEDQTKAAVRVDPVLGFSGFRQDDTSRTVYLYNGNPSSSADDLQVASTDIVFAPVDGTWDDTDFLPDEVFEGADCLNVAAGEAVELGTLTYTPDDGANQLTQESATLDVDGASVNKGAPCGQAINLDPLAGLLYGVSGAPTGERTLTILRMMAGIDPALPDTHKTKVVSTVTPGQKDRANLSSFDKFTLTVDFDPVKGLITLPGVYTPLNGSKGIKLFNPAGSGPGAGGIWLFTEHCQIDPGLGCSDFFLYISKDDPSLAQENPTPPIYTEYTPNCNGCNLEMKAKNPENGSFENDLIDSIGVYDPAGGRVEFAPDVAVRLLMHPATGILNGRVDGALITALTTECITAEKLADPTLTAALPDKLLAQHVFTDTAKENAPWDNVTKNELFGDNPMKIHQDAFNDCAGGLNVLRGRRIGVTDTSDNLDNQNDPSGITFDLAGIGRYKHNSTQLGAAPAMFIIIKACVEDSQGDGSCNIN